MLFAFSIVVDRILNVPKTFITAVANKGLQTNQIKKVNN